MVSSPKIHKFCEVVDNIGTENLEGVCEEDVRNLRCRLASALGLVVTESLISPVLYCWQVMTRLVGRTGD